MTEATGSVRVLLVEDEAIIAMMVASVIRGLGFKLVGPAARLDHALALVAEGEFDCAILDVNIRGGDTYPVADLLIERDCPFVMASGYSNVTIPKHLLGRTRLTKPYSIDALEDELMRLSERVAAIRDKLGVVVPVSSS